MIPIKPCEYCWDSFEPTTYNQKYCSKECKQKLDSERRQKIRNEAIVEGTTKSYLKLRFMVLRRDGFRCQYCGKTAQDNIKLHIDHVKPKNRGGTYEIDNLITACKECNLGKSDVVLGAREAEKLKMRVNIHK